MAASAVPLTGSTDELAVESRRLVAGSRRWPPSVWRRSVGGASVADLMYDLAVALTAAAQLLEAGPGAAAPPAPRVPARPPYPGALSDQVAVTAHDLVTALRAARPGQRYAGRAVEEVAAEALAGVRLVRRVAS
ncbi:MAG TPA: hypothetical protein VEZ46_05745 [Mycobacteriales bacterium]|nr:hypothetical protein [Mycobacteriales bacterium]